MEGRFKRLPSGEQSPDMTKIQAEFDAYDTNKDSTVSLDEFRAGNYKKRTAIPAYKVKSPTTEDLKTLGADATGKLSWTQV